MAFCDRFFLFFLPSLQDLSIIKYRKAVAFALESFSEKGRFAADGELIRYDPIRCVVVPRHVTILGALP
jgi:hypothetical protein